MTGDTEDVSRAFADPGLSLVLRFHLTCHTWLVSSVQVDLPQGLCTPPSRWGGGGSQPQSTVSMHPPHRGAVLGVLDKDLSTSVNWSHDPICSSRTKKPAMSLVATSGNWP